MNALSSKLGLLDDDIKQEEKLLRLCADLGEQDPDPARDASSTGATPKPISLPPRR